MYEETMEWTILWTSHVIKPIVGTCEDVEGMTLN